MAYNPGSTQSLTSDVYTDKAQLGLNDYNYVLRYPLNIGNDGLRNYTVFYINVRNRDLTESERNIGYLEAPSSRTKENRIRAEDEVVIRAQRGASTLASAAVGASFGKMLGDGIKGVAGAAAGAAIVGGIEGTTGVVNDLVFSGVDEKAMQIVQLKKVIALPMMTRPSSTYKAGWVEFDTGIIGGLVASGAMSTAMDAFPNLFKSLGGDNSNGSPADIMNGMKNDPALRAGVASLLYKKMTSADILGNGAGEVIEKMTSRTTNPFKEQLFRSMGFRTFTFEYTFLPKTRREAMEVRQIIDTFKYYMHPGLTDKNFFLTYPAEFNIRYFHDGLENTFLPKISTCVLTDLAEDYGSNSDFITFKPGADGKDAGIPTEISLRLGFTELELLSKERIKDGY